MADSLCKKWIYISPIRIIAEMDIGEKSHRDVDFLECLYILEAREFRLAAGILSSHLMKEKSNVLRLFFFVRYGR